MENQFQILSDVIAYVILNDRDNIITLLSQNGMIVNPQESNEKLVSKLMNLLSEDENFRQIFTSYLKESFGLVGFSNAPGDLSTAVTPSTTSTGFFSGFNVGSVVSLVGTGLGFLSSSQSSKDQRATAEANANATLAAAVAQSNVSKTNLEIARLQLEAAKLKPASNNTLLYAGIGVGVVVVLGLVIFAVTRKSN